MDSDRPLVAVSPDGERWRRVALPPLEGALLDVAHGAGTFVGVGGRVLESPRSLLLRSAGGERWTPAEEAPALSWRAVEFGNGRFLAAALDPATLRTTVAASADGVSWRVVSEVGLVSPRLAFGAGRFVLYGESGRVGVSGDGERWEWVDLSPMNHVTALSHLDGRFRASGLHDCCYGEVPGSIRYFAAESADGVAWKVEPRAEGPAWFAQAHGSGTFLALTHEGVHASRDGASWTRTLDARPGQAWRYDAAFAGGRFVVVGRERIHTSADGVAWRATPVPE